MLVVSIDFFKGFSHRSGFSFIPQPSFSDGCLFVYRTLVVRRNGRVIDNGYGANGVSGFREHLWHEFLSVELSVNKTGSRGFK